MNEKLKTNVKQAGESYDTDRVCEILDEIGWLYDRDGDKVQVIFKTDNDTQTDLITCVADVLSDKVFISTAIGIKTKSEYEMLKLLNFINTHKVYYGRFVLSDDMSVWYDYTADIKPCDISKNQLYRAFSIADNCSENFCNCIVDVAVGTKTANEAIESIR